MLKSVLLVGRPWALATSAYGLVLLAKVALLAIPGIDPADMGMPAMGADAPTAGGGAGWTAGAITP